jgi:Holliday junction resolvase RusA-like endonuclease
MGHRTCDEFGVDAEGRMSMQVNLEMPPSDNKIYWNAPHGGRVLTTAGVKYKRGVNNRVSALIAASDTGGADFIPCVRYEIRIRVYFDAIEFKTWNPDDPTGKKGGAKTRFVKTDVGNRQKLLVDAVMSAIGIDDKHIFEEILQKRCSADDPRVFVRVREEEPRYG